jgi:hypothetical protein
MLLRPPPLDTLVRPSIYRPESWQQPGTAKHDTIFRVISGAAAAQASGSAMTAGSIGEGCIRRKEVRHDV